MLFAWSSILLAQQRPLIEEVIVKAQRVEENLQKVPIAVSAFTEAMLEDRQIVALADLHLNTPNVTFTPREGDSSSNVQIRGIGLIPIGFNIEKPTSLHINEIPLPRLYAGLDLYDVERVEVLRGPQGTLYGRNATAGALNIITRRPDLGGYNGYAELEYGDYDHRRFTAAINVPFSDSLGIRIAGTGLKRDGYIENKAGGQIPGVKENVDARDHYSLRITGAWDINEQVSLWVMYDRFDEDSTRTWNAPRICKQNPLPVSGGCLPNQFGRDLANPSANLFGIAAGGQGVFPLGARDAATGLQFDFPRPADLDNREIHADGNFSWNLEEEVWSFGFEWNFDQWRLDITGGYQQTDWRAIYPNREGTPIGMNLGPTVANPSGLWPLSGFPGPPGFLRADECNADAFQAGVAGGCVANVDQTRAVAYGGFQDDLEYWSLEAKVRSQSDGPLNFLVGANYSYDEVSGEFLFLSNLADGLTLDGYGGPRLYPGFGALEKSGNESENYAFFGELYWQPIDALTVTLGLRYNDDEKRPNEALAGFASLDANYFFSGILGPEPQWVRGGLISYLFGAPDDNALALAEYYEATDAIDAASSPSELISALQIVPPIPRPGEQRALEGRPSRLEYKDWSGRFVVDWAISPNTMIYAKYNRGFKPGTVGNLADRDLDSETIDSFEMGAKTRLFSDSLSLNAAAFAYKYHDMQIGAGGGVFITETEGLNVDVKGHGIEAEAIWQPLRVPNLVVNLAYGWLDVELGAYTDFDLLDRTQGNPDFIELNAFDSLGQPYIAPVADVLALVDQAIAEGGAISEATAPGTVYPNGVPAYFSRGFLETNGVETFDALPVDMKGNRTPHAPEHNVSVGAAYSWFLTQGTLTARWDYHWQDKSYGNVLNAPIDKIDSWGQHNASLTFESGSNRWVTRLWARNITNEDNALARWGRTGIVYGEPRIYGISVRYSIDAEGP
jgi:outer membrane receptor protein involved in Fe transport